MVRSPSSEGICPSNEFVPKAKWTRLPLSNPISVGTEPL